MAFFLEHQPNNLEYKTQYSLKLTQFQSCQVGMEQWKEEEVEKLDYVMVKKTYLGGSLAVLNLGYGHLQPLQIWRICLNFSQPYMCHHDIGDNRSTHLFGVLYEIK